MSLIRSAICYLLILFISNSAFANWFRDIWESELRMEGLQKNLIDGQGRLLNTENDIDGLMKELNGHVTGNSGWGNFQYHEYQSYGDNARNWSQVLDMAENGKSSGALGDMVGEISSQFPHNSDSYNQGVSDPINQRYYSLKSQTVISTRAASQLDYDKIQDQIGYQQMLQQQIEKTKDLKASIDLANRMQVENNLIAVAMLRQSAISNQQNSVGEQASIISAQANSRFLSKPIKRK